MTPKSSKNQKQDYEKIINDLKIKHLEELQKKDAVIREKDVLIGTLSGMPSCKKLKLEAEANQEKIIKEREEAIEIAEKYRKLLEIQKEKNIENIFDLDEEHCAKICQIKESAHVEKIELEEKVQTAEEKAETAEKKAETAEKKAKTAEKRAEIAEKKAETTERNFSIVRKELDKKSGFLCRILSAPTQTHAKKFSIYTNTHNTTHVKIPEFLNIF